MIHEGGLRAGNNFLSFVGEQVDEVGSFTFVGRSIESGQGVAEYESLRIVLITLSSRAQQPRGKHYV
jgi:hypothetical protein